MTHNVGGAATIVRTINRYAQWFRGRSLVFVNSVIGDFGESKAGVSISFAQSIYLVFTTNTFVLKATIGIHSALLFVLGFRDSFGKI